MPQKADKEKSKSIENDIDKIKEKHTEKINLESQPVVTISVNNQPTEGERTVTKGSKQILSSSGGKIVEITDLVVTTRKVSVPEN